MEIARVAELQVLLEGVPLPSSLSDLVAYAAHERAAPELLDALRGLPDRLYESLDEVGEELAPVQPAGRREGPRPPAEESGAPPGGREYTNPRPESGAVRDLDAVG